MQVTTWNEFLSLAGYGSVMVDLHGTQALVPLVKPNTLPPYTHSLKRFDSVEAQAQALLSWYNLPGVAIGLIRGGKLIYAKGFGYQDINTRQPFTEYSVQLIASPAKMLTAVAILQLAEAGKLALEDKAVKHVPWFKLKDPRYTEITIRHLMGHTSGLPEIVKYITADYVNPPWWDNYALERYLRSFQEELELVQPPSDDGMFQYCQFGYLLLAAVVQEVSGEWFEDYQRRHILEPLLMNHSTFMKGEVKPQNLVSPHIRDLEGNPKVWGLYPNTRQWSGLGGLFTNIVDVSHWLNAYMNGGVYYNRILQPATFAKLTQPYVRDPWGHFGTSYSPGVISTNYIGPDGKAVPIIFATGASTGFNTHITMFPKQGLAAIVFVNLRTLAPSIGYAWSICDRLAIQMLYGEI